MTDIFRITAKTYYGFEDILMKEVEELGGTNIKRLQRAVSYDGDQEILYKSNLHLRTALSILKPITTFKVKNVDQLYQQVKRIAWENYFDVDDTFAISAVTHGELFTHSKYAALKSKDAVVDRFKEKFNKRPDVNREDPDILINIRISEDYVTVSLDSSGQSLNIRGYRKEATRAPLSEVLAAGMIILSAWDKKKAFLDPMCGSGTIAIEAALMACRIAPGSFRNFQFESWHDFDEELWQKLRAEAEAQEIKHDGIIRAYDMDHRALEIAEENSIRAAVSKEIFFKQVVFKDATKDNKTYHIVTNPPYGNRLNPEADMDPFYDSMGTHLKHEFEGSDAWVISGNLPSLKRIGLKPSTKIKLFNGPTECRFNHYQLYRGSKKGVKPS